MKPAIQAGRLALSSMWFQRWPDRRDLRPFFEAGASMGFEAFELSHDLPPEALEPLHARQTWRDIGTPGRLAELDQRLRLAGR